MSRRFLGRAVSGSAVVVAMALPSWAMAQDTAPVADDTDEIIVTAQRRAERLEDVPMSITHLGADTIEKSGVTNIRDIGQIAAGIQINQAGAATQPAIRGVTTTLNTIGFENNVAIYVDGFYQPDFITINADLANIADVQVLKGPQGTLYGRNATGGAILINTLAPSRTFTGRVQASYGSYDDRAISLYLSGPVSDQIRFGVAGYWRKNDNYIKLAPIPPGTQSPPDPTGIEQRSVRAKLDIDLSSDVTATVGFNYGFVEDPRGYYTTPIAHAPSIPQTGYYEKQHNHRIGGDGTTKEGTLKLRWNTGIGAITSYTSYADRDLNQRFDLDGRYVDTGFAPSNYGSRTFQQTLDYAIDAISGVDLVLGGSYYYNNTKSEDPLNISFFSPGLTARLFAAANGIKSKALSVYGDATVELTDKLSLTAGARYTTERKTYSLDLLADGAREAERSRRYSKVTPRASLRFEVAPQANVYASYSKGFRSGTFNQGLTVAAIRSVDPETIDAYEVGFKIARGKFRFDAAAFYYDYRDLQVSLTQTTCLNPPSCTLNSVDVSISNAPKAEIYGLDAQMSFNPAPRLTLRAAAAYLHGRYRNFTNATATGLNIATDRNLSQVQDWSGQQTARSPTFSGNVGADYSADLLGGELELAANVNYTDSYVVTNPSLFGPLAGALANKQRYRQNAYALANASVTWTAPTDNYYVGAYVRNLTDKKYRLVYNGSAGNGGGDFSTPAPPREVGVKVGYQF